MVSATIVDLYEVELKFLEVEICIYLLVTIEAHIGVSCVAIADAATGAVSCVTINAGFQTFGVDVVSHHSQSIRKTLWMDANLPFCCSAILETVVDVDILVANVLQSL